MKNAARRIAAPFLLALLSATMAIPACTGVFDKCVKPVSSQITWTGTATELGEVVASFLLCDPTFSGPDVPACALQSLQVLGNALGPDGQQVVNCIIAYYQGNGSAALQERAKAVGAKRGVNPQACSGMRPLAAKDYQKRSPAGGALRVPAGRAFAYGGESVWGAASSCERTCGERDAIGSPGGSCLCQRKVSGRLLWIAAR